jgi:hypothetical protein
MIVSNDTIKDKTNFEISLMAVSRIKPNGPAIKGGCGTWRSPSVHYPGTLAVIYPGGKPGMACFLPIQA